MSNIKNTTINDTSFLNLPAGSTAQRPGSTAPGQLRFNTTTNSVEMYSNTSSGWKALEPNNVVATGGIIYDADVDGTTYRVHVFNDTVGGTFTVSQPGEVEYLIVAGGGGGGDTSAGGGGAGGLVTGFTEVDEGSYSIVIGDGGTPTSAYSSGTSGDGGFQGGDSSAFGLTGIGGGGGGSYQNPGTKINGGSGGGVRGDAQNRGYSQYPSTALQPDSASGGFGHRGGTTVGLSNGQPSSGGGGAGGVGQDAVSSNGGDGGPGISTSINGIHTFYAGGGGGSGGYLASGRAGTITNGLGGYGGGGNGGRQSRFDQDPFCTNGGFATGGGGGGNGYDGGGHAASVQGGGAGGSGIVIVRYPLKSAPEVSAPKVTNRDVVFDFDFGNPAVYAGQGASKVYDGRGGNIGNVVNDPLYLSAGSHAGAFRFNGSNQHIGLGRSYCDRQELGTGNVSYSLESWFKLYSTPPGDTTNGYSIFGNASSTGVGMQAILVGGNIRLNFGARSTSNFEQSTNLSLNTWYHVVCVREAGVQNRIYINGELDGTLGGSSLTINTGAGEMQIAWSDTRVNNRFHGEIATAKLYKTWLTAQEVLDNYNATRWRYGV